MLQLSWILLAIGVFTSLIDHVNGSLLYTRDRFPNINPKNLPNLTTEEYMTTIVNASPANTSWSLDVITHVPLKSYEFKYDTIIGRRQVGLLGPDVASLLPHSVQSVSNRIVYDPITQQKVALQNFQVVDKDVLFMHNVGATQQLIQRLKEQNIDIKTAQTMIKEIQVQIQVLQDYLTQEASTQLIEKRRIAEAQVMALEKQIEQTTLQGEQERLLLAATQEKELQVAQTTHLLAQERLKEESSLHKEQNRDLVELQEASQLRMELKRRETEEVLKEKQLAFETLRIEMDRNTSLETAQIQVLGRIQQQRENQDIEMNQLKERLEADRIKVIQMIHATFDHLGQGMSILLTDQEKLIQFVGGFVILAAGIYLSRESIRIGGKWIEQRLGKPSLVRETSRKSGVYGYFYRFFARIIAKIYTPRPNLEATKKELAAVVLSPSLETRVQEIAKSIRNTTLHHVPYRHLLLYGPPGTGKTMVAKKMALVSNMDYAILSGGDIGPLGSDAVTELHALFQWAQTSTRGVLIFIDEAEAFLGCRATRKTHMSEAMRNALNALLYHTGTQSNHFMLVIATNRPEDLDAAITDRIDDTLHFHLPETNERIRLLQMYYREYISTYKIPSKEDENDLITGLKEYGKATKGMSGREIAKMMLYLQSIIYAQDQVMVTKVLIDRVIKEKILEHARKIELRAYKEEQE